MPVLRKKRMRQGTMGQAATLADRDGSAEATPTDSMTFASNGGDLG